RPSDSPDPGRRGHVCPATRSTTRTAPSTCWSTTRGSTRCGPRSSRCPRAGGSRSRTPAGRSASTTSSGTGPTCARGRCGARRKRPSRPPDQPPRRPRRSATPGVNPPMFRPVAGRWLVAAAAALAVATSACGAPPASSPESPTSPQPQATGMPVTIDHALGSTTITAPPQRVVTIGWSDQDPVLALGVKPVGTTEWFDEQPGAIFPWATEAAGGHVPEIVSNAGEINFEKVAALQPDLILALYEGL